MTKPVRPISILVVDDDHDFTEVMSKRLDRSGYEVVVASSEKEARQILKARAKQLNLALLDMYMDTTRSGLRLVELIGREYPWMVTIVVTGWPDFETVVKCMEAGAFSYVTKANDESFPDLVVQTIEKASLRFSFVSQLHSLHPHLKEIRKEINNLMRRIHDIEAEILRIEDEIVAVSGQSIGSIESNDGKETSE